MKFILINDIHLSHRGPQSRTDDWQEAIFAKLDQVSRVAVKVQAKAVCIAGDIFHHKSRIAYGTVVRLLWWAHTLKTAGVDVLAIPGNHDEVHDRYDSVESQPLGVLFTSGLFTNVSYLARRYSGDMNDVSADVVVTGVPYPDALLLPNFQTAAQVRGQGGRAILLAHCFATPQGGTFFGTPVHRYSDLTALPFDVFHFGHDHSDHGVGQIGAQFFVNIGALSRGSLAQEEVRRDVKVAIADFAETITVRQIKLKIVPASEVFDLVLKEQKDRERGAVEAFVGQLSADLAVAGPVSFKDRVAAMGLSATVRTRVQSYLDDAEASLEVM